jgi:hypothetical protein
MTMHRVLKLTLGLALIFSFAGDAAAKSRKAAPANPPAANGENDSPIPLPDNLKTNNDWLDDGAAAASRRNMGPNARANDNYFTQQQNFRNNDPLRHTETGSVLDNQ